MKLRFRDSVSVTSEYIALKNCFVAGVGLKIVKVK